jgi:hypothetical protein
MPSPQIDIERIVHYSVGHGTDAAVRAGEIVVLLPQPVQGEHASPSNIRLAAAFEMARGLWRPGVRVRVIGTGASLPNSWPDWIREVHGFVTTELGAYRMVHPIVATRDLSRAAHDWLDRLTGGKESTGKVSEALYASLAGRVLQPAFDAVSCVQGLVAAHPGAVIHCADPNWSGLEYLRSLAAESGGDVLPAAPARRHWRRRMAIALTQRLVLAVAGQVRRYYLSAPSRKALRKRRRASTKRPHLWLALQPDWPRINRHVVAQLDKTGADYGILLTTTLIPGDLTNPQYDGPIWPAVTEDVIRDAAALDQIAGPSNLAMLVVGLVKGVLTSIRAATRLMKGDNRVLDLAGALHRTEVMDGTARLLTVDIVQTVLVGEAARSFVARCPVRDDIVVFANLNFVDTAAADWVLRNAGATTVDFRHGSGGGGWFGMHESFASHALVWSATDISLTGMLARPASVVKSPPLPLFRQVRPIARVLVITGYSHDCWASAGFPLRPYEIEMLEGAKLLQQQYPELDLRWRPHPSDEPSEIAARLERFPFLVRSQTIDLADDLAWADLVVSYGGTTLGQAVSAGVAIIAHVVPELLVYPDTAAIDGDRQFFRAAELPERFALLTATDPATAAAVDHRLFDALFAVPPGTATISDLDFTEVQSPTP